MALIVDSSMGKLSWLIKRWLCLGLLLIASLASASEYVTYLHPDVQGSPVVATNEQGQVIWRESYAPWGEREIKDTASANPALGSKTWYTGKEEEEGLGLYYYGARWYSPNIGQFYSIDPAPVTLENPRTFGRYLYANNNPIIYKDPDGRSAVLAAGLLAVSLVTFVEYSNAPGVGDGLYKENGLLPFFDGIPAGRVKKTIDGLINVVPNGNSRKSDKEQHGYEILDTANNPPTVAKTGVSGQPLNQNGSSPRANQQANAWNKEPGNEGRYAPVVVKKESAGPGARERILQWERNNAQGKRHELDPARHSRP